MRIRMKTIVSGPHLTAVPGQVIDVPDDQGRDLVEGHYAEAMPEAQVDPAPAPAQADSAADQGGDQGGRAAKDTSDTDEAAQRDQRGPHADPEAEYRAELTEKNVKTLKALVEAAGTTLQRKALKADMVDALIAHRAANGVETAEAAAGENAAARTDAPQPRRRRQPSGKGPGG